MNRRDFIGSLAGVGAGLAVLPVGAAVDSAAALRLQRSTLVVNGLDTSLRTSRYLDLLSAGGVNCWHQSVGGIDSFAALLEFCDEYKDRTTFVKDVSGIREAYRQGKIAHLAGWQSADVLISDGRGEPRIGNLRAYRELGLRFCGIAYNNSNAFGSGCIDPHLGLTQVGRRLIEQIHAQRIILDVGGHTGEQTSLDAISMSAGVPVVCTHTNVKSLTNNARNSSDRLLEAIAATGGVIGVTAFSDFHQRTVAQVKIPRMAPVSLERHLDEYDYIKKLVGIDHVGLGPDYIEGKTYPGGISRERMPREIYGDLPWDYVQGFEDIGKLPDLTRGLMQRGWTDAEVRKLLGENWLRVYEKVWGA